MSDRSTSSSSWTLTAMILSSIGMMLLGPNVSATVRSLTPWTIAPMGDVGTMLANRLKKLPDAEVTTDQRIEALQGQVEMLQQRLAEERGRRHLQTKIYSQAFSPSGDSPVKLIGARIVASDSMPYGWARVANVGMADGARKGMYVAQRRLLTNRAKRIPENLPALCLAGLAGRVTETGAFTARLQLVTDRAFKTRAQVRRVIDRAHPRTVQIGDRDVTLQRRYNRPIEVLAQGDGKGHLLVRHVHKRHAVRVGDVLETVPDDGALPAVVRIGTVTDVEDESDAMGRVTLTIQPAAKLDRLGEVILIVPELAPLSDAPPANGGS